MDYRHSVSLDLDKCKGCTHCLRRCPTEAIRIRDGHAVINAIQCIDCGECLTHCPQKIQIPTKMHMIEDYTNKLKDSLV